MKNWIFAFLFMAPPVAAASGAPVLLDARSSLEFHLGHVPGALNVHWDDFTNPDRPLKGMLLSDDALLARKLGLLGIEPGRSVVVMGDGVRGWGEEGRIAWMLTYLGVKDVRVLDIHAARKEFKGASDVKIPAAEPWRPVLDENLRVSKRDVVRAASGRHEDVTIIDVRDPSEYRGASLFGEKRGGHIPGSINIPWREFVGGDGSPVGRDEIVALLRRRDAAPDKKLIFYCTGGVRAGYATFAARRAGLDAANYDGSFWEWAADDGLPVER